MNTAMNPTVNLFDRGRVHLVIGGIRSGKSAWAERQVAQLASDQRPVIYIATGVAVDAAMEARIRRHRERRPAHWQTLESPLNPVGALQAARQAGQLDSEHRPALLLDSLDVWASNLLLEHEKTPPPELEARVRGAALRFVLLVSELKCDAVVVSSEVGQSPVATTPLGRQFQDLLGMVNQDVAAVADDVTLIVAGLPVPVKRAGRTAARLPADGLTP